MCLAGQKSKCCHTVPAVFQIHGLCKEKIEMHDKTNYNIRHLVVNKKACRLLRLEDVYDKLFYGRSKNRQSSSEDWRFLRMNSNSYSKNLVSKFY